MTASSAVVQDARAIARRFIDAFNDRDLATLRELITDGVEFRRPGGEALRGEDGLRALIAAADDMDLRLVALRAGTVDEAGGAVQVAVPVRELIGPDDVERLAEFEILDGHVAAFDLRPVA